MSNISAQYVVEASHDLQILEAKVTKRLEEDYDLVGTIVIRDDGVFYQALVKKLSV